MFVKKKSRINLGKPGIKISAQDRTTCLQLIDEAVASGARQYLACQALGLSIRRAQRWRYNLEDQRKGPLTKPHNALSEQEITTLLQVVHSKRFADLNARQIVATLAQEGTYLASESTIYRLFRKKSLLAHRRRSAPASDSKPEPLVAKGPNEI